MKIIVCLDDNNGMLFNKRRQSRDAEVIKDIWTMTDQLWIHSFSKKLLEGAEDKLVIDDEFLTRAGKENYCFVENQSLKEYQSRIDEIIIYKWNREYPADFKFDISLETWNLIAQQEFTGHSHEKITKEIYVKYL